MTDSGNILYQRWRTIASNLSDRVAWMDASSDRVMSFGSLADAAEQAPTTSAAVLARSSGVEFLLQTLQAWRFGVPLAPLEPSAVCPNEPFEAIPEGIAHLKQTSGSTGTPRWVLFEAKQLVADAQNIMRTMEIGDYAANVGVVSLSHSYGFSNLVLPLLLHGVPLVTVSDPLPATVDRALDLVGGNAALPAVPAMWRAWESAGILDSERIGLAISAGAPLQVELERRIHVNTGVKVHNFYGSSECGGIAYDPTPEPRHDATFAGLPLAGVEVSRSDAGTLVVEGAAVGVGYWPEADEDALSEGRFLTSDLAEIDDGGGVRLLGRADDLINVAGRKIAPQEIEAALAKVEGVEECLVFGIPSSDPSRFEEIVACVRSKRAPEELAKALRKSMPSWQTPKRWWSCNSLAPNSRGKFSREQWRRRFLDRQP